MKLAVAGGTGVVGRYAVTAAEAAGHEVVVLSRSRGVDVAAGRGVAEALAGVEVVIDALNTHDMRRKPATAFFEATSRTLQSAGAVAGVAHIVALSIVGLERVPTFGYYQAKLAHERAVRSGQVPVTVLRATQFFEFPAQIMGVTHKGPFALVPRMRSQPVAARTVGAHLVRLAVERPAGTVELAGPEVHEMPELAKRLVAARSARVRVLSPPLPMPSSRAMRSSALLATEGTIIDGPTFAEWLATDDARAVGF